MTPTSHRTGTRHPDTERVVIDEAGRLVIPARFRRALGIRGRGTVVIGVVGDSLRIRTIDGALERLQRLARRKGRDGTSAVDGFIAERRTEAAGEDRRAEATKEDPRAETTEEDPRAGPGSAGTRRTTTENA